MAETEILESTTVQAEQEQQKSEISPIPSEQEHQEKSETSGEPETPKFDPETMRATKPKLKRLFLTLSVLFSFLLGLPFLWKSVEIYRSPLPFNEMEALSNEIESKPLQFPYHFQTIFITSNPNLNQHYLKPSITSEITKLTSQHQTPHCSKNSNTNFTLSVRVCKQSYTHNLDNHNNRNVADLCGAIAAVDLDFGDDDNVDEVLESVLSDRKVYSVVVVGRKDGEEGLKVVVGKHRHAWILGTELDGKDKEVVKRVAELFVNVFGNGGRDEGLIHEEFMPVGSDGRIVLSFNLLNSNPSDWIYDW